jgi:hypothetical protein
MKHFRPRYCDDAPKYNGHTVRRLARHFVNALTLLSLLLCLATLALWARSHWIADAILFDVGQDATVSTRGRIAIIWKRGYGPLISELHAEQMTSYDLNMLVPGTAGFALLKLSTQDRCVTAPHWAVAALFASLPAIRFRRMIVGRRQPIPVNACAHCDYDLRATPDRCPECGAIPNGGKR